MTTPLVRTTHPNRVLAVLFAGAFVMGCAGDAGRRPARPDRRGPEPFPRPLPAALVTANALGLAVGGPALTFLTTRFDRRVVVLATLAVFVAANLLIVVAAGYGLFVGVRVLVGAVQGLFIAAGIVMATSIVAPERTGRAMAVVISGFATASALGLPVGTLLGQAVGWRGAFLAVITAPATVPDHHLGSGSCPPPAIPAERESRAVGQAKHAFSPRRHHCMLLATLIFAALQSALTYLLPFLHDITGVTGAAVTLYLLAYGVATTLGSSGGGRFADADAPRALIVGTVGVAAALAALHAFGDNPILVTLAVLGLGLFAMGMAPWLEYRVVELAGPGGALAASLPASAVNAGIALGAFAGGRAIDLGGGRPP